MDRTKELAARRRGEHYDRYEYATEEQVVLEPKEETLFSPRSAEAGQRSRREADPVTSARRQPIRGQSLRQRQNQS